MGQAATKRETKHLFKSLRLEMTLAEYEELVFNEKEHFFECPKCGEFVDKRELRDVIFHVTGHKPKPEIPTIKGKAIPERPSERLGSDRVS